MRHLPLVCFAVAILAPLQAAEIDGKWASERKMEFQGQTVTITQTYELKADGAKLTGSMTMQAGEFPPQKTEIANGKVDGNKFSFETTMQTPNGDFKVVYKGAVEGGALKGTAEREGREPRPFEAKKI